MSGPLDALRERYRRFAWDEARGRSPLYEALALAVAESDRLLAFVSTLPEPKQQPNLVFAAVRHLHGTPADPAHFAELVEADGAAIRAVVLARSTQTNEPGRCAALLPALARLPQPLALLEVGASAGLCLLPDHYAYDYGRLRLAPPVGVGVAPPVFPCRVDDATPLPASVPTIAWRAGLDLNPVDLADAESSEWLRTLVWPGQEARAGRLRGAMEVAARVPVPLFAGDLLDDLPRVAAVAPAGATLVVFHTAVLAYVEPERRERFAEQVAELGAAWIASESPEVLPSVAAKAGRELPPDRFLLSMDGEPLALAGPHGESLEWIA